MTDIKRGFRYWAICWNVRGLSIVCTVQVGKAMVLCDSVKIGCRDRCHITVCRARSTDVELKLKMVGGLFPPSKLKVKVLILSS